MLLTGPTRAVVLIDPVKFEIQLKAKGTSESEDKVLNFRVLVYHHDYSLADPPFIVRRRRRCKRSELEFAFTLLVRQLRRLSVSRLLMGRHGRMIWEYRLLPARPV